MQPPRNPRHWRTAVKIVGTILLAIVAMPLIVVALFGTAGGRRS